MPRFILIRMHVSRHIWNGGSFLFALTNVVTMTKTVVMIMKDDIPVKNHTLSLASQDSVVLEARGWHCLQTMAPTIHCRVKSDFLLSGWNRTIHHTLSRTPPRCHLSERFSWGVHLTSCSWFSQQVRPQLSVASPPYSPRESSWMEKMWWRNLSPMEIKCAH